MSTSSINLNLIFQVQTVNEKFLDFFVDFFFLDVLLLYKTEYIIITQYITFQQLRQIVTLVSIDGAQVDSFLTAAHIKGFFLRLTVHSKSMLSKTHK